MVLRSDRTGIEKKFFDLCLKVVDQEGLSLYDLDYLPGSSELRVFIQDPETGSAVLDDCAKIDRALSPYIEEEEWMPQQLTLEVSSPGMYRQLNTVEHFKAVIEENIMLTIKIKLDEESFAGIPKKLKGERKLIGRLTEVTDMGITLNSYDYDLNLKFEDIKKANLEPVLN